MTALLLLSACKPSVPSQVIQPDKMEDILYDYYVSQGMATLPSEQPGADDYRRELYFNVVLKKYGLTRAEFDSSMVFYYTRADRFVKIYKHVQQRLSDDALALGASEGEVERFMSQSLTGDTAEIWEGNRTQQLIPYRPYNRMQFHQKADTTYHKGDSFMFAFQSDFLYQGGSKDAVAYIAVKYDNDSIAPFVSHFSVSGSNQLRIPTCENRVKEISGYFYLGDGFDNSPNLRLLFLSNIQLIRFHRQGEAHAPEVVPAAVPDREDSASATPDSLRPQHHRLGERPILIKDIKDKEVKPITR